MRKLINNITPAFILKYNQHLLTHSPLGWQLQLPVIGWLWLLVSIITIPVPCLYELDLKNDNDVEGVILLGVMIAVLQFFMFAYILIQFNSTKTFGSRSWWYGLAEQLSYTLVMLLCLSQLIAYPVIVEYRKSQYMTEELIIKEAKIFNHGRHYFMDNSHENFMYFPNDSFFVEYLEYRVAPNSNKYQAEYYNQDIKPLMEEYILSDSEGVIISPKITRETKGPKLYMVGASFLDEEYLHLKGFDRAISAYDEVVATPYYAEPINPKIRYQLERRTTAERLEEIKAFIKVYYKYELLGMRSYENIGMTFESPESILKKYISNQIVYTQHYKPESIDNDGRIHYPTIDQYSIEGVHSTIMATKYRKLEHFLGRLMICFHVALVFSLFMFLFKNNRLRDFILMFVYSGILALVVTIMSVLVFRDGDLAINVPLIIFLIGIVILINGGNNKVFSSLRSVVLMLSNLVFAYAPVFLFLYFDDYLHVINHYDSEYCLSYPDVCSAHERMLDIIQWTCFWGGSALYLFVFSIIYKRAYERQWALPMGK